MHIYRSPLTVEPRFFDDVSQQRHFDIYHLSRWSTHFWGGFAQNVSNKTWLTFFFFGSRAATDLGQRFDLGRLFFQNWSAIGPKKKNLRLCLIRYISGKTASKMGAPPWKVRQRWCISKCLDWETSSKKRCSTVKGPSKVIDIDVFPGKRRRKSGAIGALRSTISVSVFFFLFLSSLCLIVNLNWDKEEGKGIIPCLIYIYFPANAL